MPRGPPGSDRTAWGKVPEAFSWPRPRRGPFLRMATGTWTTLMTASRALPPELVYLEHEAFGTQFRAKQKIAEVRKLRAILQEAGHRGEAEVAGGADAKNPCHACGQFGHWSREVPKQGAGSIGGEGEAGPFPILAEQADCCRGRG